MSKHTPGPWRAEKHPQHDHVHCSELWMIIAGEPDDCSDAEIAQVIAYEAEANARLIAAAPDMLEALKEARALLRGCIGEAIDRIDAALAKAEGRS